MLLLRKLKNKSMNLSGPIKDGNINGNLVTVLVLINYRSKYLTNFEANAKQNEVKINRFSEELPADADDQC
jgi:hypothetical protein